MRTVKITYCPPHFADYYDQNGHLVEGEWRKNVSDLTNLDRAPQRQVRMNERAKNIREVFKAFVNSPEGSVDWQRQAVFLE